MIEKVVLKWSVPVDDNFHPVGAGRVVLVQCQSGMRSVEVWTEEPLHNGKAMHMMSAARVYGTGQPIPDDMRHLGSAIPPGSQLVWHLYSTRE